MLHVLICEDNPTHRTKMETIIAKERTKMKLTVSTSNPTDVLAYLKKHPSRRSLYFLDVDLQHEIDGITLGAKIREADPLATIVFVTAHEEMSHLTFKQKVQALDYIIKDKPSEIETRMLECAAVAHKRHMEGKNISPKFFTVNTHGAHLNILLDDILYFEPHPRTSERMILHTAESDIDFRGLISKVTTQVPDFYRCHKSFLVNPKKIARVDRAMNQAIMTDGSCVYVATRKMAELIRIMELSV